MAQTQRTQHTPVMQQYLRAKAEHGDAFVFFRLGDFYEMFFEDAVAASELLDLALTSRGSGPDGVRIPMAGVPHHAAASYIRKLLDKGKRVALCEQMADPGKVKGMVPREVVRVITPGVCLEPENLDGRAQNYLVAVVAVNEQHAESGGFGVGVLDVSTAELRACTVPSAGAMLAELHRLDPREVLLGFQHVDIEAAVTRLAPRASVRTVTQAAGPDAAHRAAATALAYARVALGSSLPAPAPNMERIAFYDPTGALVLDDTAVRNLELVRTLSGERLGSLLHLVDETCTPMGARLLRRRVLAPLLDTGAIAKRHDAVQALVEQPMIRQEIRACLGRVGDLERLATRAELGFATPRDLASLRDGWRAACELDQIMARTAGGLARLGASAFGPHIEPWLDKLADEPALRVGNGEVVRARVDAVLDELRLLSTQSRDVILELERRERQETGIGSLKIRFTKVFGYFIEVTKSNLRSVPDRFRRKQTVAQGERFTTDELDDLQTKIFSAEERAEEVEGALFVEIRAAIGSLAHKLRALALRIADLDVHCSFAEVAHRHGYVRPVVDASMKIELRESRHPVVEKLAALGTFVPNDVAMDAEERRLLVITGPNMAGKSTVMRQTALAVILAQAGSFVPASSAIIGVVDRIFTRVGASDNVAGGESTFMVEMRETAALLRGATRQSLVLLDEVGRGTSTYDGLAIAQAVAEHILDVVRCRTLFATHYHELCELGERPGAVNLNVAAEERGDQIVLLHRLVAGAANRSYGIAVAKLAALPETVLSRARLLLADLEERTPRGSPSLAPRQGSTATPSRSPPSRSLLEERLQALEINSMTPLDALVALAELRSNLVDSKPS